MTNRLDRPRTGIRDALTDEHRTSLLDALRKGRPQEREVSARVRLLTSTEVIRLSEFLDQGGWSQEFGSEVLDLLKQVLATRKAASDVSGQIGSRPVQRFPSSVAEVATTRAVEPAVVSPANAIDVEVREPVVQSVRERRVPLSEPRVAVSRSCGRTSEGRRNI
ncbi:MAG TPA: hypothetical protein DEG92_06670 [Rikenellaceae bacterium]|nr:hypothetical protein [Rikenellaceae bacterium]